LTSGYLDTVAFNHGICEKLIAHLLGLGGWVIDAFKIKLDKLANPRTRYASPAQALKCPFNGLALDIQDTRLEKDVSLDLGHQCSPP
jgi:hypothetical protein